MMFHIMAKVADWVVLLTSQQSNEWIARAGVLLFNNMSSNIVTTCYLVCAFGNIFWVLHACIASR